MYGLLRYLYPICSGWMGRILPQEELGSNLQNGICAGQNKKGYQNCAKQLMFDGL